MASGYSIATHGRELTREQVATTLIAPLQAAAVVLQAGPQVFLSQGGVPLRIPKISTVPVTDPWRGENTLIAEVDPTFDELVLLPSSLKSLKILHRFSNELARHSVVGIVSALQNAFVSKLAGILDSAFLVGDGTDGTITGLTNQDGVQDMAGVGAVTIDDLFDAESLLLAANADPSRAAWFLSPRSITSLRKLREGDGAGQYLLTPDVTAAGRYTLLGHPVYVSTQVPEDDGAGTDESTIVLADMSKVAVGIDDDFTTTVLDQTFGNYDQQALRVTCRYDIGLLNAEGVVVLRGVTA